MWDFHQACVSLTLFLDYILFYAVVHLFYNLTDTQN